jgi:tetratricopeptide (TPR) repeat protein
VTLDTPVSKGQARPNAGIQVLRWFISLLAGGAVYLWVVPSALTAFLVFWYVFETSLVLILLFGPVQREIALVYALPRAVGSALAFVVAYLVLGRWDQVLCLAYVLLLILEALYRVVLRGSASMLLHDARAALDTARGRGDTGSVEDVRLADWRAFLAAWCAGLIVLAALLGGYVYGVRQVLFDTRFYVSQFEDSPLYDELLRLGGRTVLDVARGQGADVRRAVDRLSVDDVSLASRLVLPREWTVAVAEQVLEVTLVWVQSDTEQRVPPIALPIGDIERHVRDATSVLLDQHMTALPICSPAMSEGAWCRREDMSVTAHIATYKPDDMAIVDEVFEMIPAELDLATLVSMSPRTFEGVLTALDEVRLWAGYVDRALSGVGKGIVVLSIALYLLCAIAPRTLLRWMGATWLVAGVGSWGLSLGLSKLDAMALLPRSAGQQLAGLPETIVEEVSHVVHALTQAVYGLLAPWSLALAALGLVMLVVGLALSRAPTRRARPDGVVRALVVCLAVGLLVWVQYPTLGQRLYDRAFHAHRDGDIDRALSVYRRVVRWYPLVVDDFVLQARRGLQECERFQRAASARKAGQYEVAAQQYEAFLVGNPAIALRELAETGLVEALYGWAGDLEKQGVYERALDRYRYVRDEFRGRGADAKTADLLLFWGDALLEEGDHHAAVSTYGRIAYDVPSARYWRTGDERRGKAYCQWQAVLRAAGESARAAEVCQEFLDAVPDAATQCAGCAR